jgi:DNA-binding response OmpR family regulator
MIQDIENRGRILVADDEEMNVEFFDIMLTKLGFTVDSAFDGEEVLRKICDFLPDLLLLDLIMPKVNGIEVVNRLKADDGTRNIPIIVLTAVDDINKKVDLLESGIDDYIIKPFNFIEILARIRSVLRQKKLREELDTMKTRFQSFDRFEEHLELFIRNARDDSRCILDYFEDVMAEETNGADDVHRVYELGKKLLDNIVHLENRYVELKG